jgi:hypothetical protein
MNQGAVLSVVVHILGPRDFSWTLLSRRCSTDLSECISASSEHFNDYNQALDAGFLALHGYRVGSTDARSSLVPSIGPDWRGQ